MSSRIAADTRIVADTSCLIGLDNIGKLDLLSKLYSEILVPPTVEQEFGAPISFAEVCIPRNKDLVHSLRLVVGPGESEAIALAKEEHCSIILDDKKARLIAEELGLAVIGTVGILLKAKQSEHITLLSETLARLEKDGFYISVAVKREALRLGGET